MTADGGIARIWPALLAHAQARAGSPSGDGLDGAERALLGLYRDFLRSGRGGVKVVAHLGQSLDGRIATASGHSSFVSCEADLVHMHRMRALADAVIVGAGTVDADDPQLTVRLVTGPSPVRVVLDRERCLAATHRLFTTAPPRTLLFCRQGRMNGGRHGLAEVIGLPTPGGQLDPGAVLATLQARGLRRIFIEGGGITVSRFLEAGCLDRLQLCVAPVILGSGRAAMRLAPIRTMADAMRLAPEVIQLGSDWLFACRLERRPLALGAWQPEQIAMPDREPGPAAIDGGQPGL